MFGLRSKIEFKRCLRSPEFPGSKIQQKGDPLEWPGIFCRWKSGACTQCHLIDNIENVTLNHQAPSHSLRHRIHPLATQLSLVFFCSTS